MPGAKGGAPIADKYALDYYHRPLSTRKWKRRWNWLALLISLMICAVLYALLREKSFYAAPLSQFHSGINDCKKCHDRSWQTALRLVSMDRQIHSVSNAACQSCHREVADHHHTLGRHDSLCATCHQEHRPEAGLLDVSDDQCVTCHGNLNSILQSESVFCQQIERFAEGEAAHPEFAVLRTGGELPGRGHRVWDVAQFVDDPGSPGNGKWLDRSGLLFNHQKHLAPNGVLNAKRENVQLTCSDCHTPDSDGKTMAPLNYEKHCAECHPLRLGGQLASLGELPHQDTELVRGVIRERLLRDAATSNQHDSKSSSPRRIPLLPKPVRLTGDESKSVEAKLVAADLAVFGNGASLCRNCHDLRVEEDNWEIMRTNPQIKQDSLAESATAQRPLVPHRWLKHARFDHKKHQTRECSECHQAAESSLTSDILMPSISICRQCHGSAEATISIGISDRCEVCHDFHSGFAVDQETSSVDPLQQLSAALRQ